MDPVSDKSFGRVAQSGLENAYKAVLGSHGAEYPTSGRDGHNLRILVEQFRLMEARDERRLLNRPTLPDEVIGCSGLTPNLALEPISCQTNARIMLTIRASAPVIVVNRKRPKADWAANFLRLSVSWKSSPSCITAYVVARANGA